MNYLQKKLVGGVLAGTSAIVLLGIFAMCMVGILMMCFWAIANVVIFCFDFADGNEILTWAFRLIIIVGVAFFVSMLGVLRKA